MHRKGLSQEAVDQLVEVYLETKNITHTAQRLGLHRNTVSHYINRLRREGVIVDAPGKLTDTGPIEDTGYIEVPEPPKQEGPTFKLKFTVRPMVDPGGERWRVCAIGDAHSDPRLKHDRFLWMGRHVAQTQPDAVVQIGDFLTFDSLCRFDGNETLIGQLKPSFEQDIEGGIRDLKHFNLGLSGYEPKIKHVVLGNHEDRVLSFTNRNPEIFGIFTGLVDNLFMSHGWTYSPFGQIYFLGGVGFVHYPLTTLGKPYGGKTALQRACNDLLHDLVVGHDHKAQHVRMPKIGTNRAVQILGLGCSLPHGHTEKYIRHDQMLGWSYGIYDILIDQGAIQSAKHISMLELEELYGQ